MPTEQLGLGYVPKRLPLRLTPNADFIAELRTGDGSSFPPAAVVTILVADRAWVAAIDGDTLTFSVDKAVVAEVIASRVRKYSMTYVDGETDLVWFVGPVVVSRA